MASGWVEASVIVLGISSWYLIKKRKEEFAKKSILVAASFGLFAVLFIIFTGHGSAQQVAAHQPMKLAVMEGLYEGREGAPLVAMGVINPKKETYNDDVDPVVMAIEFPKMLSWLSFSDVNAYVPGIRNIVEGGYTKPDGKIADSFETKKQMGQTAITALKNYKIAEAAKDTAAMAVHKTTLDANYKYFGYGYLNKPEDTIPNVPLVFYSFHIMVILGVLFLLNFALALFLGWKNKLSDYKWILWVFLWTIPLGYLAGQLGWIVAEVGRQPWTIQDILPVQAAVSSLQTSSVLITFVLFAVLFTVLLIAEISIMLKQIRKGPESN